ncbi:MAG: hypothetical protein ACSHW1_17710 [Yoonia sp.]|uniref:hypothetical protein n=1 Tax=Yoonia sp. TaxID=2212373 RepID=UPI003EF957A1
MQLVHTGVVSAGDPILDVNLTDMAIMASPAGVFLYAVTGRNGGVSAYELSDTGGLAYLYDTIVFRDQLADVAGGFSEIVEVNGRPRLVFGGDSEDNLTAISINGDGSLGYRYARTGLESGVADISDVVSIETGGHSVVILADESTGTIASYDADILDGSNAIMDAVGGGGPVELATADFGSEVVLVATDTLNQGVVSYTIDGNAQLLEADTLSAADGVGIAAPTAIEVVQTHGLTWVLVAAAGTSSITVMKVDQTGMLTPTDHLIDSRDTRFGAVQDIEVVEVDGWAFVIAGGGDDGLSLFTLLDNGHLLHLQTIVHDIGSGLQNVDAIEAVQIGDEIQVFVTSQTGEGVSQFSISLADLGDIILADPFAGGQTLTGTTRNDLISSSATGDDTLFGGHGDDILRVGQGDAELWGGAGRDGFVFEYAEQAAAIMDFEAGVDWIDLSALPMLYDVSRLNIETTAQGAVITYGDFKLTVTSSDSTPLDALDLFGAGFTWAQHYGFDTDWTAPQEDPDNSPEPEPEPPQFISGSDEADSLTGGSAGDTLSGVSGDDFLSGAAGDDIVWGGSGDDDLFGGAGNDLLSGSSGQDTLTGGDGDDLMRGGDDNDVLRGESGRDEAYGGFGDDRLSGGDGNDELWGDHGDDMLWGGDGRDILGGFVGNDVFYGGDGWDVVWGHEGDDLAWGGGDGDTLGGGAGNDTLYGDDGDDLVWGGDHDDLQFGGAGADTVGGFSGDDTLYGGDGDDHVWGNVGDDLGYGGDGNDLFGGFTGNDTFFGGAGDDTLSGGDGDDYLDGGSGADTFRFFGNIGTDVVADFEAGLDVIHLAGNFNFEGLNFWQNGSDTVLILNSGTVTLEDLDADTLSEGDFLFGW